VLEILGRHHGAVRSTVVMLDDDTGQLQVDASDGLTAGIAQHRAREGSQAGRRAASRSSPQISREPMFLNRARSAASCRRSSASGVLIMLSRKAAARSVSIRSC
jgi:hypothetical protein